MQDSPMPDACSSFDRLPLEILRKIVGYCSSDEICITLPSICKRLRDCCQDAHVLKQAISQQVSLGCYLSERLNQSARKDKTFSDQAIAAIRELIVRYSKFESNNNELYGWMIAFQRASDGCELLSSAKDVWDLKPVWYYLLICL